MAPELRRSMPIVKRLVAHRGQPARHPENSLPGILSAIEVGARWIEVDVQLTRDGVPVALHDARLDRVTGKSGDVRELDYAELRAFPLRNGDQPAPIPRLSEVVEVIRDAHVDLFIELKRSSLHRFGRPLMVRTVLSAVRTLGPRCCVISFDRSTVALARRMGAVRTGWVISRYDAIHRGAAFDLAPDYLFCRRQKVPLFVRTLWPGPWRWVIYVVDSPAAARRWLQRGADLVESDRVGELIRALGRR